MKKLFSILAAVVITTAAVSAKDYTYSLGLVGGLGLGAQFKVMAMPNFTIIEEFGYFTNPDGGTGFGYAGAINNLVLAWQDQAASGQGIKLDYYAGGQIKAGYAMGNAGVIGFGAAAGIEANMQNAPIAFSFDFRPGYAVALAGGGGGGTFAAHMFDWSLNLGVRYTF